MQGVVGVINGIHIHACISVDQQIPYWGHGKGEYFYNVKTIYGFGMVFQYVIVGWEGKTHDSRLLSKTIHNQ